MKKQFTLEQVLDVKAALDALDRTGVALDVPACIAIERLSMALSPIIKGWEKSKELPGGQDKRKAELEAYRTALGELQQRYLLLDKNGDPVTQSGYPLIKMDDKYKSELSELKKKHLVAAEIDKRLEDATSPETLAMLHEVEFEPLKASALKGDISVTGPIRLLYRYGIIEA